MWEKYDTIWDAIKNKLNIKFHSKPIYEQKYLKAKVKEFDGVIKTNFQGNGIPNETMHYTCVACITIDSVMRIDKKKSPAGLFRRVKYKAKKMQMPRLINTELKSESDSELDSEKESKFDAKLMAKLESGSDSE